MPLTFRALLLVPLLAVAVDQARATLVCGPRAESCLAAAGQSWLGAAGVALLVIYSIAGALGVARLARRPFRSTQPVSLAQLWLVGSAGVAAVCGGQALLARALGSGAALGGGWALLLALCVVAGGLIALALRAGPAAAKLLWDLRPSAPRPRATADFSLSAPAVPMGRRTALLSLAAAGRAPPRPLG